MKTIETINLQNFTGHSKGPFVIAEYGIAYSPVVGHYSIKDRTGRTIAVIDCAKIEPTEAFANAQLLAAAPVLLAERNRLASIINGILKDFTLPELSRSTFADAIEWKNNRPHLTACINCGVNSPESGLVCDECKADSAND